MTQDKINALHLLGVMLVEIRGIAGDAINTGHASTLGGGVFSPESACEAIYALADAAHNMPDSLAASLEKGTNFLPNYALAEVAAVVAKIFGERSTFQEFLPVKEQLPAGTL